MPESVARVYGRRWSAGAAARAEHFAGMTRPAWEAVAAVTGVGPGTRVLDVGCGSGEFCALATGLGASAHGIDASDAMIALARSAAPDADLRVGTLEDLPWPAGAFDVVTGFNAFQFAPDMTGALAGAAAAVRPGGLVAVCNWGEPARCDLVALTHRVQALCPEPTLVPRRPIGDPGVLEGMLGAAGLAPGVSGEVAVPWAPPDEETLVRGLSSAGNLVPVIERVGAAAVGRAVVDGAAPFRRDDGGYLFRNVFRYVLGRRG